MSLVQPTTYNEVLRFKKCLMLRNYISLDENLFNQIYAFLANPKNKVVLSKGMLVFQDELGHQVDAKQVAIPLKTPIETLSLTTMALHVTQPYTASYSGGDGGSGSNNNNNNNNNNNG